MIDYFLGVYNVWVIKPDVTIPSFVHPSTLFIGYSLHAGLMQPTISNNMLILMMGEGGYKFF